MAKHSIIIRRICTHQPLLSDRTTRITAIVHMNHPVHPLITDSWRLGAFGERWIEMVGGIRNWVWNRQSKEPLASRFDDNFSIRCLAPCSPNVDQYQILLQQNADLTQVMSGQVSKYPSAWLSNFRIFQVFS